MRIWFSLCLAVIAFTVNGANLSLTWDIPSPAPSGYRLYISHGESPFTLALNTPTNAITIGTLTNIRTRYFVTAIYPSPPFERSESAPSDTFTNEAALSELTLLPSLPPKSLIRPAVFTRQEIVILPPHVENTNVLAGKSLTITGRFANRGNLDAELSEGRLSLAPVIWTNTLEIVLVRLTNHVLAANGTLSVHGSWTPAVAHAGPWECYLSVRDKTGKWTAGPATPFSVFSRPLPALPPTSLRVP